MERQQHHYFASFVLGWATGVTRGEAVEKLISNFRSDFKTITANCQKDGEPGCYLWSCKVDAPADSAYKIRNYAPYDVKTCRGLHHHVTYVTGKKVAYTTEKKMAEYD